MKKLAIIATHPVQYYAPLFQLIQQRGLIDIKVFYTWGQSQNSKYDPGFNRLVEWDLNLLEGYPYLLANNVSTDPGSHHFKGMVNPDLIDQIKNYGASALLVIGWAYHSHLKAIRYFKNKMPIYFRGDSNLLDEKPGLKTMLRSVFLKWVYSHIDHAFYVGTNNKSYYQKYGLANSQMSFAPHAIDNERFAAPRKTEVDKLRAKLGLKTTDTVILYAGKFEEKKSPGLLLSAFLQAKQPGTHLLFVGNGPLEQSLKQQAANDAKVHFMDFCNQLYMPVVYQACDIFCLPSQGPYETWGLAINEAMACGKAIIVSDKCGCATDLVSATNGIIFKSGSIDEITLGLRKLMADSVGLAEMGQQSSLKIKGWTFGHIAQAIEHQLLRD
jgi:glycosyltransferase involved in cell wall biosynthesis